MCAQMNGLRAESTAVWQWNGTAKNRRDGDLTEAVLAACRTSVTNIHLTTIVGCRSFCVNFYSSLLCCTDSPSCSLNISVDFQLVLYEWSHLFSSTKAPWHTQGINRAVIGSHSKYRKILEYHSHGGIELQYVGTGALSPKFHRIQVEYSGRRSNLFVVVSNWWNWIPKKWLAFQLRLHFYLLASWVGVYRDLIWRVSNHKCKLTEWVA